MNKPFAGISSRADMRPNDYRFPRHRSDDLPLEKSPPLESWTSATAGGVLIVVFMLLAFYAAGAWAWVR